MDNYEGEQTEPQNLNPDIEEFELINQQQAQKGGQRKPKKYDIVNIILIILIALLLIERVYEQISPVSNSKELLQNQDVPQNNYTQIDSNKNNQTSLGSDQTQNQGQNKGQGLDQDQQQDQDKISESETIDKDKTSEGTIKEQNDLVIENNMKQKESNQKVSKDHEDDITGHKQQKIKLEKIMENKIRTSKQDEQFQKQQLNMLKSLYKNYKRQPMPKLRKMTLYEVTQGQNNQGYCGLVNAINIVVGKTVHSINALLKNGVPKVAVLVDSEDLLGIKVLTENFGNRLRAHNVTPDAQYKFLQQATQGCQKVVFLQNNFELNPELLLAEMKALPSNSAAFSSLALAKDKVVALKDLRTVDLESVSQNELSAYVFLFDSDLLRLLTPLNFAYFNRFVLEEMIILPIAALLQKTERLRCITALLHGYETALVQFKEFVLEPRPALKDHLCFVSYPSDPYALRAAEFAAFADSLAAISGSQNISVVIAFPYSHSAEESIWNSFQHILDKASQFASVRVRIWANKTASSLVAYESAYTYCPASAIIVASRFNIRFDEELVSVVMSSITEKHHYYTTSFTDADNMQVDFKRVTTYSNDIRTKALYFKSHFQHVQIFKADLLKMHFMHILKSAEIDFYETEASFVIPMLETIRLNIKRIDRNLFAVLPRQPTKVQEQQIHNLGLYYEWPYLKTNILVPKLWNSLQNVAFRKNAPLVMPKKIHQIWLSDTEPSAIRMKLHQTMKDNNPTFQVYLWKNENLTAQNFPIGFSFLQRSFLMNDQSDRSLMAPITALMRYEILYNNGGIYMDFKTQGVKSLEPFLKYTFFSSDLQQSYSNTINWFGNGYIGSIPNNYHLLYVLKNFLSQDTFNYNRQSTPKMIGGFVLRNAYTTEELLKVVGYGFHLIIPRPVSPGKQNLDCMYQKTFTPEQEVFDVKSKDGQEYKIGIPCKLYPESYTLLYHPLAKTWLGKKYTN